ncbi:MAG TPA: heme-binding domain-containing protein [Verrucomicrobiae bacterium]|nr:heme-binding domain-containing protein [Verrucomicrobiae bacterium]
MKKYLKWTFGVLIAGFILLQLANPSHTNPPVARDFLAATMPPPEINTMFRSACYDCHSDETKWPWYSRVAPVSWLVANDVTEGRKNLNLSEWPTDPLRAAKRVENMSEQIEYQDMPPKKYTLIHRDARLTENQRKQLEDWLTMEAARLKSLNATAK